MNKRMLITGALTVVAGLALGVGTIAMAGA
jgi:hypothetical protein